MTTRPPPSTPRSQLKLLLLLPLLFLLLSQIPIENPQFYLRHGTVGAAAAAAAAAEVEERNSNDLHVTAEIGFFFSIVANFQMINNSKSRH